MSTRVLTCTQVREQVIGMVLGTDMTTHFDTVGAIKAAIASHG